MTRTTSISRGQGMRRSAGTLLALVLLFAACASPPPPRESAPHLATLSLTLPPRTSASQEHSAVRHSAVQLSAA